MDEIESAVSFLAAGEGERFINELRKRRDVFLSAALVNPVLNEKEMHNDFRYKLGFVDSMTRIIEEFETQKKRRS